MTRLPTRLKKTGTNAMSDSFVHELNKSLREMTGEMGKLTSCVQALEQRFDRSDQNLAALGAKVDEAHSRISRVREELDSKISATRDVLVEKMGKAESSIAAQRASVSWIERGVIWLLSGASALLATFLSGRGPS